MFIDTIPFLLMLIGACLIGFITGSMVVTNREIIERNRLTRKLKLQRNTNKELVKRLNFYENEVHKNEWENES